MDLQQRTRRFGIGVILCACVFRFFSGGGPEWIGNRLRSLQYVSFPIYSETGRNVRFSSSSGENILHFRESPGPWIPEPELLRFSEEETAQVDYDCDLRPDLAALLLQPLQWDLVGEEPSVLILHTHTTESYTKTTEAYRETSDYRTLSEEYNMLSVGDAVAAILEESGIRVIHDRQLHDYPSYNGSYVHARSSAQELLKQFPSVRLILDLHRDAVEVGGRQLRPLVQDEEEATAQLMFVVGTNVSRQSHEGWQENLALALKFHAQLERQCPGIMRPLNLRSQRFNQDLLPGAVLVEVGSAGNTHPEALRAAEELAAAVVALARGTAETG